MDVKQALAERKSTRAFEARTVEQEKLDAVLDAARHAPSGVNTQPWKVAVVTGEKLKQVTEAMESTFRAGQKGKMDYQYYPLEWQGEYKERRKACGLQMYQTLEIGREDKQRQMDQWAANYRGFDAPVILFFLMDGVMEAGSFLDYGMFMQSVMLAAQEQGLATCPQAALAEYPEIVKQQLGYAEDTVLVAGMAMGYEDTAALINSYRTPREEVDAIATFYQ
ncbi:MAG: nitroreductase [Gammaproteobacteria bacterium]|jgi:nitroreductase|nr:nitroreductase [Gammaproteobacteria bacterium]MBT4605960.1 nitroreductase [Thiotrichales bacterium]MBT3471361.1 nitroreductase [Gammaproteobacteria bacterium]MBT4080621.1 nitroreductase [Gammaproteobacteria bacterium]MBT4330748.1 nitroreductase [Gammaproteobacteria bacterium]